LDFLWISSLFGFPLLIIRVVTDPDEKARLGAILRAEGMVTREMLLEGLAAAGPQAASLGAFLNVEGHRPAREINEYVAEHYRMPALPSLPDEWVDRTLARKLPAALLLRSTLLPFARLGTITIIAFAKMPDDRIVRDIRKRLDGPIKAVLCDAAEIARHLDRLGTAERSEPAAAQRITDEEYAAFYRASGIAAAQRWAKLFAGADPLPAAFLGKPKA
jgi:hypothetical protein